MKSRLDTRKYNGASLLGLNGIVIKSHGNADRVSFESALLEAVNEAKSDITSQISAILAKKLKANK